MNRVNFFHVMLFTNVPGWEDVLEKLDEPSAEIWYHDDTPIPHYHIIAHSDKCATVAYFHKVFGFFAGLKVELLANRAAYHDALLYARSKGVRYVNGEHVR